MKKIENFYLTIQSGRPESNKNPFLLGFFCSFLLFFFSCASFVLNFSLIFSPDFSFMRMVELCMILGFGGALLFSFRKTKRFFLLFFGIGTFLDNLVVVYCLRKNGGGPRLD